MANGPRPLFGTLQDESLRKLIRETYQNTVTHMDCDPELRNSLRTTERLPLFIANLEAQFRAVPVKHQTKDNVVFAVRELTKTFIRNIQTKAHQQMMSDAEKTRIETHARNAAVLDKAATDGIITEEVMNVLSEEN